MPNRSGDALACSFCGKTQRQVLKLIAGPGVYICEQCVDLCNEIIEQEIGERPVPPPALDRAIEDAARAARDAVDRLRVMAQQARALPPPDDPR